MPRDLQLQISQIFWIVGPIPRNSATRRDGSQNIGANHRPASSGTPDAMPTHYLALRKFPAKSLLIRV